MTTSDAERDAKARWQADRRLRRMALHKSAKKLPWLVPWLCFLLSLAMHLPFLGMTPLAGTEGHRVLPAHEMVRTHWAYVPILFDKPFMTKPPLHHWLIAASEKLLGHESAGGEIVATSWNLFVWRLPSALAGAALAAVACLFAARWFGKMAGGIAGVCTAGMIAIWGQSQVADIDATNTLVTALAALSGIELLLAMPRKPWRWIVGAGVAIGATLMTKGPAGLPIIVGVWIYGGMVGRPWMQRWGIIEQRRPNSARNIWMPWVIGIAIFAIYCVVAWFGLKHRGLHVDFSGIKEGTKRLRPQSVGEFIKALAAMLPQLYAFALPVSLGVLLLLNREVRQAMQPRELNLAVALGMSLLLSWAVCVLSGMTNPRYGYPTLIVLCPLAGAVAVAAAKTKRPADYLRGGAMAFAVILALTTVGLSAWAFHEQAHLSAAIPWHTPRFGWIVFIASLLALSIGAWAFWRIDKDWDGAVLFIPLLLLVAIPFGFHCCILRTAASGITTAADLRRIIGNEVSTVTSSGAVTSKPETFYYAHLDVNFTQDPKYFNPKDIRPGVWVVYDEKERTRWKHQPGIHLEREKFLCKNGDMKYFVVWYAGISKSN